MHKYIYIYIYMYIYTYIYIHTYISFLFKILMCVNNANGIQVVDLQRVSNAIVQSDFRLTDGEICPFPFRNAPASVTLLVV